ncbi:MAG: hypothetical protein U9R49_06335 [Bacteroidota bacterium]|nr:hypothetical protein [Bacteroidota bacterium]
MKKVKNFRILGLALLCSFFVLNLSAQRGSGRGFQMTEEDIKERVESFAKTLEMNEDQHKKALAVEMDFYNKRQIERQKMMNAGGPPTDREAMRAKMMKMRDERNAQYEDILSADQYKKFIDIQEQRQREMREQRQQSNPDGEGGDSERSERGRGRG